MSSTVFILGAGASKRAGAPLMAEFLDVAHENWKHGKIQKYENSFSNVFKAISSLQQVHSKAILDIQNVESVFAALEMARTIGGFGDFDVSEAEDLFGSMKTVIASTIQTTIKLPVQGRTPRAPYPYEEFIDLLQELTNKPKKNESVSVITFNYDLALDYASYQKNLPITYSLSESDSSRKNIPLLKLHGSLNWAECIECNEVVPWYISDYFRNRRWNIFPDTEYAHLTISDNLSGFQHNDHKVKSKPFIVPPTWNKTEYHRILSPVWSRAAKELGEAENIFVIGYSLPSSDFFFRYLYALGSVGPTLLKRFWVFNPDQSGDVENRFKSLLGPGAKQRFKYYANTFSDSIGIIRNNFS